MTKLAAPLVAWIALAGVARADDEIARGAVVKIDAHEIYVDLGSERGVRAGAKLRLKRPIAFVHPTTREKIRDWLPIGEAIVTDAGRAMSRVVVGDLVAGVKLGDIAEVLVEREPAPHGPPPAAHPPAVDPETAEVLAMFAAQVDQPIDARIATWQRFVASHPSGAYAEAVRGDVDALSALHDRMRPPRNADRERVVTIVSHDGPRAAPVGAAIPLVFVLQDPARVASGHLHYRARGAVTYRDVLLDRDHDRYLRGVVPAEVVRAPGVEYFVEVAESDGAPALAVGSPSQPHVVAVAQPSVIDRFDPTPGRSTARLAFDYMSFATFDRRAGDHTDTLIHATADFTYQMRGVVESLGVGYGVYRGQGGFIDGTWTAAMPAPTSGFHYGYADVEVGDRVRDLGGVHVSIGGQLIAGVGISGFGMGAEGRLRLGDRESTNLVLSGRTVDQVGFLSEIRFGTQPVRGMLLGLSVGATNQPNNGDVGLRLGAEVDVIAIRNLELLVRASWQGRAVDHGGIGGGAAVAVSW